MKFGNWEVTDEGLVWDGQYPKKGYWPIDKLDINKITGSRIGIIGESGNIYVNLVDVPEKTWVKKEDIYTLNTAFIYALKHFGIDFDIDVFSNTLKEQQFIIEDKEE